MLVVDDEPAILRLLGESLEDAGWRVSAFDNPARALLAFILDPDRFDVVITDQTMPAMSGMELIAEILAKRPEMPVILCTGYSDSVTEDVALAAGVRRFFYKPLNIENLLDALADLAPAPIRADTGLFRPR